MFSETLHQLREHANCLMEHVTPRQQAASGLMSVGSAGALLFGLSTGWLGMLAARTCASRGGCFSDQVHDRYGRSLATPGMNVVDTSSEDSFPASDPPSFNAPAATPTQHETKVEA
jgi:hypothetical protein